MKNDFYVKYKPFFNKVLFQKQIAKIWRTGFRNYLSELFRYGNLLFKTIALIIFCVLVVGLGFGLRNYFLHLPNAPIIVNPGIAFSNLANVGEQNHYVVYLVEAIPIVIAFFAFCLIPKWYGAAGFAMMFFGGLCNIIGRSIPKVYTTISNGQTIVHHVQYGVVDYFHNIRGVVFNINDVFVIMGVCLGILGILIWIFLLAKKEHSAAQVHN